jgi:4-hydroxybenzoate polyprenyltransferase
MQQPAVAKRGSIWESLKYLVLAMRPAQWVKNAFVLPGLIFAQQHLFTVPWAVARVAVAFVLFCVVSGCVYLMNDLADIEQDRLHPRKRLRPLPSGKLSPNLARGAVVVLGLISLLLPWLAGIRLSQGITFPSNDMDGFRVVVAQLYERYALGWFGLAVVLLAYFLLQVAYTFRLKHVVIIDLFCIAGGFVLRAVGGAVIIQVIITPWWLMCVLVLALFLGLGKRRNELVMLEGQASSHRRILDEYSLSLLDNLITIVVTCTIFSYSFATFSAPSAPRLGFPWLMLTIPFVIYALFRYLYLIYQRGDGGTPEELLFRDRPFFFSMVGWGLLTVAILLLFGN